MHQLEEKQEKMLKIRGFQAKWNYMKCRMTDTKMILDM